MPIATQVPHKPSASQLKAEPCLQMRKPRLGELSEGSRSLANWRSPGGMRQPSWLHCVAPHRRMSEALTSRSRWIYHFLRCGDRVLWGQTSANTHPNPYFLFPSRGSRMTSGPRTHRKCNETRVYVQICPDMGICMCIFTCA